MNVYIFVIIFFLQVFLAFFTFVCVSLYFFLASYLLQVFFCGRFLSGPKVFLSFYKNLNVHALTNTVIHTYTHSLRQGHDRLSQVRKSVLHAMLCTYCTLLHSMMTLTERPPVCRSVGLLFVRTQSLSHGNVWGLFSSPLCRLQIRLHFVTKQHQHKKTFFRLVVTGWMHFSFINIGNITTTTNNEYSLLMHAQLCSS